jgi:Rod binding domain-containing protein
MSKVNSALSHSHQVEPVNKKVMQAAKMYEQMFMREMYRAMRKSVVKSELLKTNMGEKIFSQKLDDKYVEMWSQQGGTGLAQTVYDHIMERFGHMYGGRQQTKPQGPLPLNQDKVHVLKEKNESGPLGLHFRWESENQKTRDVVNPWPGVVKNMQRLEGNFLALFVEHDNGNNSTLLFDGQEAAIRPGESLAAGKKVGTLAPDARELIWRIIPTKVEAQKA